MKYLIMGDIHGNLIALEEVLNNNIGKVDRIISHGDVVNYGPWSNECVELLEEVNAICLKGNHEHAFINGFYPGKNDLVKLFFTHTFPLFNKLDTIKKYADSYENDFFCVKHTLNEQYYFPDSDLSQVEINKNTIIGHSHYSFIKKTLYNFYLVNTGSVGQNRKNLNEIEYCLYDTDSDRIEIKRIYYSAELVINKMETDKYPTDCIRYYRSKL